MNALILSVFVSLPVVCGQQSRFAKEADCGDSRTPTDTVNAMTNSGPDHLPARPVHTYSIVARDPKTGEMGVAVQSHYFSVGPIVPWAEAGVGAVATQSLVEVSYGPRGLELMREGKSARAALEFLLAKDAGREVRQVAMIDARGEVAAHTGASCIPDAGHVTGEQFSVQANLMANADVWPAMARAYHEAKGDLADRMLAALEAAQQSGGDIRGQQSAAVLVVRAKPSGEAWRDRVFDLRVEDHPDPVTELKRLVRLRRAYSHCDAGDDALTKKDLTGAMTHYAEAAKLAPEVTELVFWQAVGLFNAGRESEASPLFKQCFDRDRCWRDLVPRLSKVGLLKADAEAVRRLTESK